MIKRILFICTLVFFLFALWGCTESAPDEKAADTGESSSAAATLNSDISVEPWPSWQEDWKNPKYPRDFVCVPDAETAIAIADRMVEPYRKYERYEDFTPTSVYYDEEAEVWLVVFTEMNAEEGYVTLDSSLTFAIRKADGCVVSVFG